VYAIGEISIRDNVSSFRGGADIVVGTLGRLDHFIFKEVCNVVADSINMQFRSA
jgi:superfamily II DNA/RNA helicase